MRVKRRGEGSRYGVKYQVHKGAHRLHPCSFPGNKETAEDPGAGAPANSQLLPATVRSFSGRKWYGGQGPLMTSWQFFNCLVAVL